MFRADACAPFVYILFILLILSNCFLSYEDEFGRDCMTNVPAEA